VIKGLHHNAYRCRDSEETRRFYEDFLGLPLANAFVIRETKSGRRTAVLHSFYRMDDGSDRPFTFKKQHDYDLHIALEIDKENLQGMLQKGKAAGVEVRGVADHGFIHSIYFRDPNGYVIELTARHGDHESAMDPAVNGARRELDSWQEEKPGRRRAARRPLAKASARRRPRAKARPAQRRS
jgi:catechol 2,3-dioxygenase-like lactoylglutathione lyase family enzyme